MILSKNILIVGGTGSLGHELTEYFGPRNTMGIFSRDENKQCIMRRKYPNLKFFLGDARNKTSLIRSLKRFRPNIIIFAAAQKHIDICETEVSESIDTNIFGIRNLIEILEADSPSYLEAVLFISTDKACNPINVYGQCKAISEKLMLEASKTIPGIKFVCVRYGNVVNSTGSIIPLFKEIGADQTRDSFPVTTHGMTRFFMSLAQAVNLIETSLVKGCSGELWIFVAPSYHIDHIAKYYSDLYNKPISMIGIRPGEKIHEDLYSIAEDGRTRKDGNFVIITPFSNGKPYNECSGLTSESYVVKNYDEAKQFIALM